MPSFSRVQPLTAFTRSLILAVTLLVTVVLVFLFYVKAEKSIDHANSLRHELILLVDELRQSSDDLTNMVRLYVSNGNPQYKRYYQEILDIRNGKRARPENYRNIYWDEVVAHGKDPEEKLLPPIALLGLMQQSGITDAEFKKVLESKANSDVLTRLEYRAIEMVESDPKRSPLVRSQAQRLLFSKEYLDAKVGIMRPIGDVYAMIDERTDRAVGDAEAKARRLRVLFILFALAFVWSLYRNYQSLRNTLGGGVDEVQRYIARIGSGDLTQAIPFAQSNQESVLAWLEQTRTELRQLELERVIAESHRQRMTQLYSALSQCNQAIVRCTNQQELFSCICPIAVNFGGMKMAWIGLLNKETSLIVTAASYGSGNDYLAGITISVDAELPSSQGPTGTALREDRPVWCQNFQKDSTTAPWHERAARYGWGSSAALPLHLRGAVIGTFTLYSGEVDAFDEDARNLLEEMALDISFALNRFADDADRQQYLSELHRNQTLMKMAGELAKIGAWAIELPDMRVVWSDEVCIIHEMPIGTQPTLEQGINFYAPEHLARIQQVVGNCISHGIPFDEELQIITATGKRLWVRAIGEAQRDTQGTITRVQGAFQDITESKRIEAEMHANDVRYQLLFQSLITGFGLHEILCNDLGEAVDYRFLEINPAFERLTGLLGAQVIGHTALEVLPGLDKFWIERYGKVALTGKTDEFEYPVPEMGKYFEVVAYSPKRGQFVTLFNDVTKRKKAENAIRESEFRQRRLLQNLQTAVVVHAPDTHIQFSNARASSILGLSVDQLNGKLAIDPAWHFVDEHNTPLALEHYPVNEVLATLKPFDNVVRGIHIPGRQETTWVMVSAFPEFDSEGALSHVVVNFHDITPLRNAERSQRESDEIFTHFMENSPNYVFFKDENIRSLRLSKNFEQMIGKPMSELLGKNMYELFPSDLAKKMVEDDQKVLKEGKVVTIVEELNGRFYSTIKFPVLVEGKPTYLAGYTTDITEQKITDERLRKLTLAVEQSPNTIVITDLDANIEYANATFTKVTGYSLDEVIGKNPRILQSGGTPKATYKDMWSQLTAGKVWHGELINRRKDGSEYIEAAMISPVRQADGKITNYLAIKQDITAKRRDEERIQQLAHFDHLTGLPNRSLLNERFSYALSLAQRSGEQMAVMFLDLDHFKNINDTLGHSIGDRFLMEVAARLKSTVREEDTVTRLGGDEFILIFPGTGVDAAAIVANKLIHAVSQPYQIENHELIGTPSIGIAIYPDDGDNFEDLLKNADTAMYRVKQNSRNDYRFFTAEMQSHSERNLQLVNAMRHALARNEFHLQYQPQITLRDGHIIGAEALLRWNHPELGMISPAEFIPIAEDSGQIIAIGEWVLRTAVQQMKNWLDSGLPPMVIAVNISAVQFRQPNLPELVTHILEEAQLPSQYLELELTEAVAMDDPQSAISVMDKLFERGIRMSIDDFGTGYSSLSYLKRFKVYKLKIDQSFVRDIGDDSEDKAIVTAIINLASSLGMHTIAEGVETASQLAFLRLQGCDEVQGYYFSKPLPAEEFDTFVRKPR